MHQDPIADACSAFMDLVACPFILKKIQEGYDAPESLCKELDACNGGSNFVAMPEDPPEILLGLSVAVTVAIITSTAAAITLALASALIGVVAVMLNRRKARLERNEQTGDDPDVADESEAGDESHAEGAASTVDEPSV